MFRNPSLTTRIAIGKGLGAVFGLIGFVFVSQNPEGVDSLFRWGVLLWYITIGAIIGLFGVYSWHPILKIPMPWWFRAPWIGAWLNFILVLLAYDALATVGTGLFGADSPLSSPFWFVVEGAVVGFIIGFVTTHFGGEGPETVAEIAAR